MYIVEFGEYTVEVDEQIDQDSRLLEDLEKARNEAKAWRMIAESLMGVEPKS